MQPSNRPLWLFYVSIIFFTYVKHFPLNCSTGPHHKRWYLFNFVIKSCMMFFWYLKSLWRSDPTFTEDFSYLWGTQPFSSNFQLEWLITPGILIVGFSLQIIIPLWVTSFHSNQLWDNKQCLCCVRGGQTRYRGCNFS